MPADYDEGTPERLLVTFLTGWQARSYGQMARCLPGIRDQHYVNRKAGDLRERYAWRPLRSFELIAVRDEALAVTVITARLVIEEGSSDQDVTRDFQLINEDAAGNATVRGKPGSWWVLYTAVA